MSSSSRQIKCDDRGLYLGDKLVFATSETPLRLMRYHIKDVDLKASKEEKKLLCEAITKYLNSYKVEL